MRNRIIQIIKHPAMIPSTIGVVSFATGLGAGYILCKELNKRALAKLNKMDLTEPEFPEQLKFVFDSAEEFKEALQETKPDLESPVDMSSYFSNYRPPVDEEEEIETERPADWPYTEENGWVDPPIPMDKRRDPADISVDKGIMGRIDRIIAKGEEPDHDDYSRPIGFAKDGEDWDYVEEIRNRTPDLPYVLHKDEFYSDEMDWDQITLTYFAGDDIMADEDDKPVYDYVRVTGPLKFGHGSDDPNTFHVRNEKNQAEYEVVRFDGLFSQVVLGLEIENNMRVSDLKHSKHRTFREE